jgi:hypothetical protein
MRFRAPRSEPLMPARPFIRLFWPDQTASAFSSDPVQHCCVIKCVLFPFIYIFHEFSAERRKG